MYFLDFGVSYNLSPTRDSKLFKDKDLMDYFVSSIGSAQFWAQALDIPTDLNIFYSPHYHRIILVAPLSSSDSPVEDH